MTIEIMNKDACQKAIRQIGRIGAKLQLHIHRVAVSALSHAREHGDVTIACNLLGALPKGQRVKALAYWFEHFSNGTLKLTQAKDGTWSHDGKAFKARMEEDFDIPGAAATSFADLTAEKNPGQTFTADMLIKKLKQWANEDGTFDNGTPKVDEAARDLAADLVASLERPKLRAVA